MLLQIIHTPAPLLISLLIFYFILASVTTWDIRLAQAIRKGRVAPPHPRFGVVICVLFWAEWGIWLWIMYLDWKLGLLAFALKFILAVLPVLKFLGKIIMWPFLKVIVRKHKKGREA